MAPCISDSRTVVEAGTVESAESENGAKTGSNFGLLSEETSVNSANSPFNLSNLRGREALKYITHIDLNSLSLIYRSMAVITSANLCIHVIWCYVVFPFPEETGY